MTELLIFALVVILAGIFLLMGMVRELAPNERRQWFLGLGLGAGIIAFTLKMGLIVFFSMFPDSMPALYPDRVVQRKPQLGSTEEETVSHVRSAAYTWEALPEVAPYPLDNPPSPEKIALGKKLFFDKRLSADDSLSCASCHALSAEKGGGDGRRVARGIYDQPGKRNTPTVFNAAFQRHLFWDGRATSLEEQAKGPLINSLEMGMPSLDSVVKKINSIAEYKILFKQVFTREPSVSIDNIAKAIASYERTLITPDSAYDRFVRGDVTALTKQQIRGMALFESTGCIVCHSGPNFSGASVFSHHSPYRFFPVLSRSEYEARFKLTEDLGVANTMNEAVRGIWRIPTLRNISRTAPYFHNGAVTSLKEAVRIMAHLQLNKRLSNHYEDDKIIHWSGTIKQLNVASDQAISDAEVDDIVAFLSALDGDSLPH